MAGWLDEGKVAPTAVAATRERKRGKCCRRTQARSDAFLRKTIAWVRIYALSPLYFLLRGCAPKILSLTVVLTLRFLAAGAFAILWTQCCIVFISNLLT
jgi:hypothetical protein